MKKRIIEILRFVVKSECFADIGCDHGKVALSVLEQGLCDKVIAADISERSLQKVIETADNEHIEGLLTFVSDGFKGIPYRVDQAVIAGMGGEEICKIITEAENKPQRLILQPMKNSEKVRRLLFGELGYSSVADYFFIGGGKYYDIIVADKSAPKRDYTDRDYEWGYDNDKTNEDFVGRLNDLRTVYELAKFFAVDESAKQDLESKLKEIEEILKK